MTPDKEGPALGILWSPLRPECLRGWLGFHMSHLWYSHFWVCWDQHFTNPAQELASSLLKQ